jgi:lysine-ketoglutarate reductase/saccharopine dehydrogenase-like protein (TIGR00300 family)
MEFNMANRKILMCPADYFAVDYVINPWMKGNKNLVDRNLAINQWNFLYQELSQEVDIKLLQAHPILPDLVFTANGGLSIADKTILSRFRMKERKGEEPIFKKCFESMNHQVHDFGSRLSFEGEGDALLHTTKPWLWVGYGVRSCLQIQKNLLAEFEIDVIPLRLIDPRFYHLDTCFAVLEYGEILYFPKAFDSSSLERIKERVTSDKLIAVNEQDACDFTCNLFSVNGKIFCNSITSSLKNKLNKIGYEIVLCPVSEFMKAGGAVKCLTMNLHQIPVQSKSNNISPIVDHTIELKGHLLDQGKLAKILDKIEQSGSSFQLDHFTPALRNDQESNAKISLCAPNQEIMDDCLKKIDQIKFELSSHQHQSAIFKSAPKKGVAPEGFYTTSIYPTEVFREGQWLELSKRRMDGVIVLNSKSKTIACKLIRDLHKDEQVLVGHQGVRVREPQNDSEGECFSFMSSSVSSERRVQGQITKLADEMKKIKSRAGKIALVAGPVLVHTGASTYLEKIISANFIDTLLSGNALAVHDIENSLYGTSLGIDLKSGKCHPEGHQHHLRAINKIRHAGSIAAAVDQGLISSGVMYACVKNNVNFVLAGSIRDDGPLPDTIMDLFEAQAAYSKAIVNCDMIIMLSTMLHSIGVGNMTPSHVKLICVDINPSVVSKLADRGSLEAQGIVTDVGLFLKILADELKA